MCSDLAMQLERAASLTLPQPDAPALDAVQALPKAIAEYPVGADQCSDLIPAIGSIKVNFARLDRREGAAVAD